MPFGPDSIFGPVKWLEDHLLFFFWNSYPFIRKIHDHIIVFIIHTNFRSMIVWILASIINDITDGSSEQLLIPFDLEFKFIINWFGKIDSNPIGIIYFMDIFSRLPEDFVYPDQSKINLWKFRTGLSQLQEPVWNMIKVLKYVRKNHNWEILIQISFI